MAAHPISAQAAIERMGLAPSGNGFNDIIDARTEDEFALDHLPGAVNWPSLTNEERIRVGTLYKQVSPFEANKIGAMLVASNIARHIEHSVMGLSKDWQPLIYCWRGGKRSGSLALVLGQIGFRVWLIEGGYKAFRAAMLHDISRLVEGLHLRIITGPTGKIWPAIAVLCWAVFPVCPSPAKNISILWSGTNCDSLTHKKQFSSRQKAKKWATWRCLRC